MVTPPRFQAPAPLTSPQTPFLHRRWASVGWFQVPAHSFWVPSPLSPLPRPVLSGKPQLGNVHLECFDYVKAKPT